MTHILFAANRTLPLRAVAHHALRELASLPMDAVVMLRKPREDHPAAFEAFIAGLCGDLGISVEWRVPDDEHGTGRSATYSRDVDAARAAQGGIFYFSPNALPENTGTGHLLERCIEEEVPVKALAWDPDIDELTEYGSSTID